MHNIEIEVRGRLSQEAYKALLTRVREEGEFVEQKRRIILDYSTFLPEEGIRGRMRDIRLRVTNGQPEIITKIGAWGGKENRKELSVKTEVGSFDTLVEIYAVLGYTKAMLCVRHAQVFMYKDIEFALVEVPAHSYYFEAEVLVSGESEVENAHQKLESVCSELGLALLDDEGFYAYIEELNEEANEMFDYSSYTEGYFKNRFDL